ncbi:hypothetical protein INS49_003366 [Diaporthe citri]|uniref:uncharacterized protein n=1 Tax=Diaporthe citri TaxID=83186 RepID=UPI001C822744|nr:uncharacterized protein INS49_003366 [Diaporthe citri]KAG6355404.1 hypothetical protein INS49_003366 [Diaporthe citri]
MVYLLSKALASQSANTKLLTALETNSETLDRISTEFYQTLDTYRNLRIASFAEEKQVRFGMLGMQIVRPDSAKIGHAREAWGSISKDHRNMTTYSSLRDDGFVKVSRKIREWVHVVETPTSSTGREIYEECLNSLNDSVARFRVQDVYPVRHKNKDSFEWLFSNQVPFTRWLSDDGGKYDAIFWITGKPGSGKSTLMRFALEDSRTMSLQRSKSKHYPMAYFFHLRGKSLVQKSLRGMLMELLYQILQQYPRSFELISPIFLNLKRLNQSWDIQSLSQAILHIPHIPPAVSGRRDRITLFIDALDENQKQDDNNTLLDIFDSLIRTYRSVRDKPDAPVLKICLASRPWPIFQKRLGDELRVPSFAIHNYTAEDIQQYTESRLFTSKEMLEVFNERQSAIWKLSADIASRAKGVFIWVRVVVDDLSQEAVDGTSTDSLQKILQKYPEELDKMYKLTLKRVRGTYRPETVIIFKTMLASRVALTVLQLYTITRVCVGTPPSKNIPTESQDVISWLASRSGGLINIVDAGADKQLAEASGGDSNSTSIESAAGSSTWLNLHVEFLHQTVQDFVRNSLDDGFEMAQPKPAVVQVSGSRLLAFAYLDSHPPHRHLRNVAKDIFSYMREVEREEDEAESGQITFLPHWAAYDLHYFPFRVRDPTQALCVVEICNTGRQEDHNEYHTTVVMSEYILEEAQKGFCEILEGKLQDTWGKYLTEDQQDEVLHTVAELVAVYLVSLERRWCIANPDRLSIRFRGLVESILQDAFSNVGAFVIADNVADFSADVFNQIKLIIDDHSDTGSDNESDNGAHAFTFESEDDENDPFDAGGDEEASTGTSAMAVRLCSPGTDSVTFESDQEMDSDTNDENDQDEAETGDPITTEDEVDMDNGFHFSTPARSDEGDENMADYTLTVEGMAYATPIQESMGNDPLFSSVAGSDKGDEDMADNTLFDEDMEDNDLSYKDMENYPLFSSPCRSDQRDEDMANDTPTASSAGLEDEVEDNDAADSEGGDEMDVSSAALHAMEFASGHKGYEGRYDEGYDAHQAQGSATEKGKSPQKGPRGKIDPLNNDLYSAIMDDDDNTTWPPKFYKCKLKGCGFQGAWNAKQAHFEIKHAEEWKRATGCEAKVHECPVDDCDYTTPRYNYIARHLKSKHPEYEAAHGKKGKKSKE